MKHAIRTLTVCCFAGISMYTSGQVTVTSQANYLFKSDTTYYVPNAVTLTGTTTFEGGTVIKYAAGASLTVSAVNCMGTPYHPVIFTAKDDNSVGTTVPGSTGNPNYYGYAAPALNFALGASGAMTNFRVAYAGQAIACANGNMTLYDGQIVNCGTGISAGNDVVLLRNLLFANVNVALVNIAYVNLEAEQVTFSGAPSTPVSSYVVAPGTGDPPFGMFFRNCVFDRLADFVEGGLQPFETLGGEINGYTPSCPSFPPLNGSSIQFGLPWFKSSATPFQPTGAGSYYLTNSGGAPSVDLRGVGASDLDPGLVEDLQNKTTWAPATTLPPVGTTWPQTAIREQGTNCAYDLGYHYDPLDYLGSQIAANTGTTTLAPGVAVGFYGVSGFIITGGATVTSQGQDTNMNHLAWYPAVQEQSIPLNGVNTGTSTMFDLNEQSDEAKYVTLNFADLSGLGRRQNLFAASTGIPLPVVNLDNCQMTAAAINLGFGATYNYQPGAACVLDNDLLQRCSVNLYNAATIVYNPNGPNFLYQNPLSVTLYNNLFWSNNLSLTYLGAYESPRMVWTISDNLFDGCSLSFGADGSYPGYLIHTHNAYFHTTSGQMADSSDVALTNLVYANAILGNRYIGLAESSTSTTALQGAGSRSTVSAGLTGFTQSTAQTPDPAEVNIGFHYQIAFRLLVSGMQNISATILTFDFSTGNLQSSFVTDAATKIPGAVGIGLAISGSEIFYTVVDPNLVSDGIHVAPYGVNGSGGHDNPLVLPNPRTGFGIQALAFHNNVLYILTGFGTGPLEVFELDPTSGAVLAGPFTISVTGKATSDSDGFVVLPDGNVLINRGDNIPVYDKYQLDEEGEYVPTGVSINLTTLANSPVNSSAGVTLAPDGQSLFFSANNQGSPPMLVQTDLAGDLIINSVNICNTSFIENIGAVSQ